MLSPEKKQKLASLINFVFAKNILSVATFVVCLIAISLLWNWLLIIEQFEGLSQNIISINREFSNSSRETRQINRTLKDVNLASRSYSPITSKLIEIAQLIPPEITISSMDLNRETKEFAISGVAENREVLLAFQETLKNISWLEKILTPASQLFQKNDIQFVVRANLKNIHVPASYTPAKQTKVIDPK